MAIQKITATTLSTTFGCSVRYWERRRKALISAGLLNQIGSVFFGDLAAIERAIGSGGPEIWGRNRPRRRPPPRCARAAKSACPITCF